MGRGLGGAGPDALMGDHAMLVVNALPKHFPLGAFCRTVIPADECVRGIVMSTGTVIEARLTDLLPILPGVVLGPAGESLPVRVLIDTGADGIYIRETVALAAGWTALDPSFGTATPLGEVMSRHVTGRLGIHAPGEEDGIVITAVGTTLPTIPADCDVLLGMGVLRFFHMVFHRDGRFSLSL